MQESVTGAASFMSRTVFGMAEAAVHFGQKKPSGIMFVLTDESNSQWCQAEYKGIPETGKKTRDLCPKCMDELLAWWADGKDGADNAAD